MNNFKNLYELTKTLRFQAIPQNDKAKDKKIISETNPDIFKFTKQCQKIQENFLDIFCYKDAFEEENKIEFKKKRKIRYGWLRNYIKIDFYDWKKENNRNDKEYFLTEVDYLPKEFLRWINEWQELTNKLDEFVDKNEEEQERKSEIAFVLRGFLKRQNFEFIQEFVKAVMDLQNESGIELDKKIKELRELISETYRNLKACERKYLPAQSTGVCLYKASLNYYTINKTPKYYTKEKEKKEKELEMEIIDCKDKFGKPEFWFDKKFNFRENPLYWTLEDAYQKMKIWKADQKSKFNEKIGNFISDYLKKEFKEDEINQSRLEIAKNILKKYPLFSPIKEDFFISFLEQTKEIKIKSKQKNDILQKNGDIKSKEFEKIISQKLQNRKVLTEDENNFEQLSKEIANIAKERGKFFNAPNQTIQTKNYYELCELYKQIAMKRGKIIAEIKGLENEEVQSQMLSHWALVVQKREKRYVVFISRGENENHKKAHDWLERNKENLQKKSDDSVILYHFKSLTLRALEKLCFKEVENTFAPKLKQGGVKVNFTRIKKESGKEKIIDVYEFPRCKQELKTDNEKINFYLEVLRFEASRQDYELKQLDLVDFGGLKEFLEKSSGDFDNLQEFESELEKVCYVKVLLYFLEDQYDKFLDILNAKEFEITTRSISKESKRKENAHAEIWKNFWNDENEKSNYITRLNPEMSVFYRDTLDTHEGNRNRFSEPRFTLATTITLNATAKKSNLSFKTIDDIKKSIDKFNKGFNKNFRGEWSFGIDRGLKELATLNIVKFAKDKNEFGVSKPENFAEITVYKLKDGDTFLTDSSGNDLINAKGEKRKIIDNISEVLQENVEPDSELFEKQIISSIDLTQAKLIKGHIILNGDQKTYLKLKELSAKRRIFELFSTRKIDKSSEITGKNNFIIGGEKIYFATEWQKENKHWRTNREIIKADLKDYLLKLDKKNKFEDIEQIEKINHLRDAITANMVGIIFHLQNVLGMNGFIGLENLDVIRKELLENEKQEDKKMIEEHFDQSNEDISRRLEWALYRKFANVGDVPPQIKESILLRNDFLTYQIGILKFVKVGGTSRGCPNCKIFWDNGCGSKCNPKCSRCLENEEYKKSKNKNIYICKDVKKCKFSTEENRNLLEENLNNSDEVAAYNVAKNAFEETY